MKFNPSEILFTKELKTILGYKDNRSLSRWCSVNKVNIFNYPNSNKRFILKAEFETVQLNLVLPYLNEKYGNESTQAINALFNVYANHKEIMQKTNSTKNLGMKNEINPEITLTNTTEQRFMNQLLQS